MRVKISNPDLSGEEKTFITTDYTSGTSVTVRNNNNITVGKFIIAGEPGQERTETKLVSSQSGDTIVMISATLKFAHPKSTPVYAFLYDKISFERKPSGGSFAEISGSPFDIDWDNDDNKTIISVPSGVSSDTYRWRFYNSSTATYSDYSDELAGTGIPRTKLGYVIQQVRRNPVSQGISDETLIDYANDFQALVYEEVPKAWWFVKEGTDASTDEDTYRYAITANWSDFLSMKFMLYKYVNGSTNNTFPLSFIPLQEFYNLKADANQSSDDNVRGWTLLPPDSTSPKGYVGLHPTPETDDCFLRPVYQFELTSLDSFGDTLVIPEVKGYIDYILYRIYDDIKSDTTNATKYNVRVARSIQGLKKRSKRQLGQSELFRYRGTQGWSKQFGSGGLTSSSDLRENYW